MIKQLMKRALPFKYFRPLLASPTRLRHLGLARYCPVCRSHLQRFVSYGPTRPECECPVCGSLERHRLIWLFLNDETDLFDGRRKRLLHLAPEWSFTEIFCRLSYIDYVTADLASPLSMVRGDITALPFPSGCFDVIYCSHVLEHIPDDRKAMKELFRVLKPTGWFLPDVPLQTNGATIEDPDAGPEERTERFGQSDHVRFYGADFKDRLQEVGFNVSVHRPALRMDASRRQFYGIDNTDLHMCRKVS